MEKHSTGWLQKLISSAEDAAGESVHKLRLGRGIVGKLSIVAIAAVTAIATVAVKAGGIPLGWAAIVGVFLVFISVLGSTLWVIVAHPELALMEGAELIMWQQLKIAVKGEIPVIDSVPIPDPMALPSPGNEGENEGDSE